jgi:ankyrin repeat protein
MHGDTRAGSHEMDRDRNTALHFAARRGDRAMISILMCARANINVSNRKGETLLLAACRAGHSKCARC